MADCGEAEVKKVGCGCGEGENAEEEEGGGARAWGWESHGGRKGDGEAVEYGEHLWPLFLRMFWRGSMLDGYGYGYGLNISHQASSAWKA